MTICPGGTLELKSDHSGVMAHSDTTKIHSGESQERCQNPTSRNCCPGTAGIIRTIFIASSSVIHTARRRLVHRRREGDAQRARLRLSGMTPPPRRQSNERRPRSRVAFDPRRVEGCMGPQLLSMALANLPMWVVCGGTAGAVVSLILWVLNLLFEWLESVIRDARSSMCGKGLPSLPDWDPTGREPPAWPV